MQVHLKGKWDMKEPKIFPLKHELQLQQFISMDKALIEDIILSVHFKENSNQQKILLKELYYISVCYQCIPVYS